MSAATGTSSAPAAIPEAPLPDVDVGLGALFRHETAPAASTSADEAYWQALVNPPRRIRLDGDRLDASPLGPGGSEVAL